MDHMPYEDTGMSPDQEKEPKREGLIAEPGRTPKSAEGPEKEERKVPKGEPGKTPGLAEGEEIPEFPNAPPY